MKKILNRFMIFFALLLTMSNHCFSQGTILERSYFNVPNSPKLYEMGIFPLYYCETESEVYELCMYDNEYFLVFVSHYIQLNLATFQKEYVVCTYHNFSEDKKIIEIISHVYAENTTILIKTSRNKKTTIDYVKEGK